MSHKDHGLKRFKSASLWFSMCGGNRRPVQHLPMLPLLVAILSAVLARKSRGSHRHVNRGFFVALLMSRLSSLLNGGATVDGKVHL